MDITGTGIEITGEGCFHGDVRVEGWLEAPNIRGFLRGMYATEEELCRIIPRPRSGWAALVGKSLPARVYLATEGRWEATGATGGAPLLQDRVGIGDSHILSEEKLLRRKGDESLWQAMRDAYDYREAEPEWIAGRYVSVENKELSGEGYRKSEPLTLNPGEELIVECNTGGEVFPIALIAEGESEGWYDFPAIGDVTQPGNRVYRYYSDDGDRVVLSSKGEPSRIALYRPGGMLRCNKLYGANGLVTSMTRKQNGGKLMADGTLHNRSGFGLTKMFAAGSLRMIHYQGYMESAAGELRALALFYDSAGGIIKSHYCGDGSGVPSGWESHPAGAQDLWMTVPTGCAGMRFCHQFSATALRFLITSI